MTQQLDECILILVICLDSTQSCDNSAYMEETHDLSLIPYYLVKEIK